ncbi:hypothetical protein [Variovorax sp. W6]|uniref:hypothetical protein n=1 Tax=Variovorax sp. W6 TaxID=3093895 RepID=UPI003D8059D6
MKEISEHLVATVGQPFDNKKIRDLLGPSGVKRVTSPGPFAGNEEIIWIPKASVRIDVYRAQKLNALTGASYPDQDGWLIGSVELLAPGSDDRIKVPFAGALPMGLSMGSTPQECIDAHGQPDLDEEHDRPGFSGRVLAWRKQDTNIAITFAGKGRESAMISHTVCLIGCIGAWRYTHPEVFAP